jgi:hypothetical protein
VWVFSGCLYLGEEICLKVVTLMFVCVLMCIIKGSDASVSPLSLTKWVYIYTHTVGEVPRGKCTSSAFFYLSS